MRFDWGWKKDTRGFPRTGVCGANIAWYPFTESHGGFCVVCNLGFANLWFSYWSRISA